jgi:hypothetical protein
LIGPFAAGFAATADSAKTVSATRERVFTAGMATLFVVGTDFALLDVLTMVEATLRILMERKITMLSLK